MILYALEYKGELLEFVYRIEDVDGVYVTGYTFTLTHRSGDGIWASRYIEDAEQAAEAAGEGTFHEPYNPYRGQCRLVERDQRTKRRRYLS